MTMQNDASLDRTTAMTGPTSWPQPVPRSPGLDGSWMAWTLATIAAIWTAVAVISFLSPDMVSGSEQQHMPIAAFGTWLWGFGASIASLVSMARLRREADRRSLWLAQSGATIAIWSVAAAVSVFAPPMVTGSDPTTIPLAALIAPIVAMLATMLTVIVVLVTRAATR